MIEARPSPQGAWWRTLVFSAATAALTFAAALVMFSAFMFYDDEGYVLISLKNFAEHGGLYRDVYSQYGPFPYVFYYLLHQLGLPFTHIAGRLITLAAWGGTAVASAAIVWRATRQVTLTVAVLTGVYVYLWIMVSEPSHPGGLIALLVALAAAIGFRMVELQNLRGWAALAGAIAALLLLTKINVGGFAALSACAWILLHHRNERVRRWSPALLIAAAVLLPFGLMSSRLHVEWVQTFALIFATSAVAAVMAASRRANGMANGSTFGWCATSGLIVGGAVVAVVCARGTSLHELVDGILLAPLRHPVAFSLSYVWPPGSATLAILSTLGCVFTLLLHRRRPMAVDSAVAVLRLLAAAGVAFAVLRFPAASPDRIVFGYGAPCLWVFLWPLRRSPNPRRTAQTWLGVLWLGQFLHPFPVAGSQIAWGTFLALPLAAVGAHEAALWLAQARRWPLRPTWRLPRMALPLAFTGLAALIGWRFGQVAGRYREGSDLGLPGAEVLRLPTRAAALFRVLTMNASAHADLLFSEPGMFSLNLWSERPTPTLANVTHWFSLLPLERQNAIVRALEAHPRACVVVQREHVEYLRKREFAPAGPLHDYIARNFSPAFTLDDFEFCVRNGRRIDPLLLGEMHILNDKPQDDNTALVLRAVLPPGRSIARIEVTSPQSADALAFHAGNARVEITPTDLAGATVGPTQTGGWPFQGGGIVRITVRFDRFAQARPVAGALITFRDEENREVALARLKQ